MMSVFNLYLCFLFYIQATILSFQILDDLEYLLDNAEQIRMQWGSRLIEVSHLLIALGREERIGAKLCNGMAPSKNIPLCFVFISKIVVI